MHYFEGKVVWESCFEENSGKKFGARFGTRFGTRWSHLVPDLVPNRVPNINCVVKTARMFRLSDLSALNFLLVARVNGIGTSVYLNMTEMKYHHGARTSLSGGMYRSAGWRIISVEHILVVIRDCSRKIIWQWFGHFIGVSQSDKRVLVLFSFQIGEGLSVDETQIVFILRELRFTSAWRLERSLWHFAVSCESKSFIFMHWYSVFVSRGVNNFCKHENAENAIGSGNCKR